MIEVTSREFRSRQASLLNLADQGEEVVIRRKGKTSYILTPVQDYNVSEPDEFELSPGLVEQIKLSREEYKRGNYISIGNHEELASYLNSL